jgi:hypothetical protein
LFFVKAIAFTSLLGGVHLVEEARMTRFWLGMTVSVFVAGCSVEVAAPTGDPAEDSDDSATQSTGVRGPVALPNPDQALPNPRRSELGRGTLMEGCPENDWQKCQVSQAQSSICVTVDGRGEFESIDGLRCRIATEMHDCGPEECAWLDCGGCLFHVDMRGEYLERQSNHAGPPWLLSGVGGDAACAAYQGTYAIYADPECASRAAD